MTLEKNIRQALEKKEILLISHAVLGYPSFENNEMAIDELVENGTELIELQIPFSDPQADGPFFTAANQASLIQGTTVEQCFQFAEKICKKHPQTHFVFMTYFNIVFQYGIEKFIQDSVKIGIQGSIIPDLPLEESTEYLAVSKANNFAPIFMFTPTTSDKRMKEIAAVAEGFLYCQARTGVTGNHTKFDSSVDDYIKRCRAATNLPIALGFGIQTKEDVDFLKGKIDIAICCTQVVRVLLQQGTKKMGEFVKGLRD